MVRQQGLTKRRTDLRGWHAATWSVLLTVACACQKTFPNRWTDEDLGFEVRSQFSPALTQMVLDRDTKTLLTALVDLFEIEGLEDISVHVYDDPNAELGNNRTIRGMHREGEVHVFSGIGELGIPNPDRQSTMRHEFVHACIFQAGLDLPRWFEEGLCDVLAASIMSEDGELVWMPNSEREHFARELKRQGKGLSAQELFSFVDGYPDDQEEFQAMYPQSASFVWKLIRDQSATDIDAILHAASKDSDTLTHAFDEWTRELEATPAIALFDSYVDHESSRVRRRVARMLRYTPRDDAWWQLCRTLLQDPSKSVRSTVQTYALFDPDRSDAAKAHYRAWRQSSNRNLALSGKLALGLCGELDQAIDFCRSLTASDREWERGLIWLTLIVPSKDGGKRPLDSSLSTDGPTTAEKALRLAQDFEELEQRLTFHEELGRYRLK